MEAYLKKDGTWIYFEICRSVEIDQIAKGVFYVRNTYNTN